MAIEARRHPALLTGATTIGRYGAAARRRRQAGLGTLGIWCAGAGACLRMAVPYSLGVVVIAAPPIAYSLGQSALARASLDQQRLHRDMGRARARMTHLQDGLREALRPEALAGWAASMHMVAPGEPMFVGARTERTLAGGQVARTGREG